MTLDRKQKDFAKRLARLSLDAGSQIEPARVEAVLSSLRGHPPRIQRALLKAYLRYLQIEDRRSRILIEHAGDATPAELESLRARLEKKYRRALRLESRAKTRPPRRPARHRRRRHLRILRLQPPHRLATALG